MVIGNSNSAVEAAREVRSGSSASPALPLKTKLRSAWLRRALVLMSRILLQGGMKVVGIASRHAAYELSAADLVVRLPFLAA